jgi:hypothetical protein
MRTWTYLAIAGGLLNVVDAVLTMRAIENHNAVEANPILALVIALSVPLFYLVKFGMAGLFCFLAAYASSSRFARAGIAVGVGTYLGIGAYHLAGLLT